MQDSSDAACSHPCIYLSLPVYTGLTPVYTGLCLYMLVCVSTYWSHPCMHWSLYILVSPLYILVSVCIYWSHPSMYWSLTVYTGLSRSLRVPPPRSRLWPKISYVERMPLVFGGLPKQPFCVSSSFTVTRPSLFP